ncbi:MAG: SpoIIE family protein phosphatase [Prevotella sp.]|nr:SpoIIE family protein phosphatase [Prevotella sp.]
MKLKFHSFSSRLTRRIIIALVLTMTFITALIFKLVTSAMAGLNEMYYQSVLDFTDETLEKVLTAVEVSAANNVDEVESWLSQPDKVYDAMESELKLNPHIIGFALAFEPNYYPQEGYWFEPYVVQRNSKTIERLQIGSAEHDYFKSSWYSIALKAEDGYWSNPYFDDAGAKMMVCSYMLPIHDHKGKTVGVFIADVSLNWLKEQIDEIDEKNNDRRKEILSYFKKPFDSYSFIIGRNGDYIVHPDRKRILNENFFAYANATPTPLDEELGKDMLAGKNGKKLIDIEKTVSYVFYSPLKRTGWSMGIVVPKAAVLQPGFVLGAIILAVMGLGLLAIFLVCRFTIHFATKPLTYLSDSANEVAKGNFDTPLPSIKYNDEIRQLRDSFRKMQQSLAKYVERLKTSTAQNASMESELNIARGIQMEMLPKTYPPYPERKDIDIFGSLTPARAVGGDLYDFHIHDERLFFCIGDVSGKGVPASLVMAVISAQFRTLSANEDQPHRIVKAMNTTMVGRNDSMMFATLFVGVINLKTGELRYCNAGHDSPVIVSEQSYELLPVDTNVPIGIVPDWTYTQQQTTIQSGSTIFLYTDGLTEAEEKDQKLFGEKRMLETIEAGKTSDPETIINNMTNAIRLYVGDAEQSDDLTMLAIRYNKPS